MKRVVKTILISFFVFVLTLPVLVMAENGGLNLELDWPESPGPESIALDGEATIAHLAGYFYEWGITVGIIVFFGMLVFAGFQYVTSTGRPGKIKKARKKIFSAFSGIILLLGSWILLNTINPELTEIETADFTSPTAHTQEFVEAPGDEIRQCEFALITHTEADEDEDETHLYIPGMRRSYDNNIFPQESYACRPERDRSRILDVKEFERREMVEENGELVEEDIKFLGIFTREGEEADSDNLHILSENENPQKLDEVDDSEEFYRERYTENPREITLTEDDDRIYDFWPILAQQTLYNSIPGGGQFSCEDLMRMEEFDRPRCMEVENGTIKEWNRKGFASLLAAFEYLEEEGDNLFEQDLQRSCPDGEELEEAGYLTTGPDETPLGYERDRSGAGCSLATYSGEVTGLIPYVTREIDHCSDLISEVSADMDHFRGMVDEAASCIELIRGENPIELEEMPTYNIFIRNEVSGPDHDNARLEVTGDESGGPLEGIESETTHNQELIEVPALSTIKVEATIDVTAEEGAAFTLTNDKDCKDTETIDESGQWSPGQTEPEELSCGSINVTSNHDGTTYRLYKE